MVQPLHPLYSQSEYPRKENYHRFPYSLKPVLPFLLKLLYCFLPQFLRHWAFLTSALPAVLPPKMPLFHRKPPLFRSLLLLYFGYFFPIHLNYILEPVLSEVQEHINPDFPSSPGTSFFLTHPVLIQRILLPVKSDLPFYFDFSLLPSDNYSYLPEADM